MTLTTNRSLRRGRLVPKSQHQPEHTSPDGTSPKSGQTCAPRPATRSQRAAKTAPAEQAAVQTQQPRSTAGPSSLPAPIIDLSASEAAAGLPPIHRPRTRNEHRASLELAKHASANAGAAAAGSPPARRRTRQNSAEDGVAGPLRPDADDTTTHGSLRQSASAAAKRRRSAAEVDHPPRVTKRAFPDGPGNNRGRMFSCAICLDEHSMEDCYTASTCGHRMCRNAARKVVLGAVRSWSFPVLCPICQARPEPRCKRCSKREAAVVRAQEAGQAEDIPSGQSAWCCTLDADVPQLLTAKEEQRYLQNSLKAAARSRGDLVTCPQRKCEGMAVTTQGKKSPALKCNICEHEWCGKCNVKWHTNKSCEEYQKQEVGRKEIQKSLTTYRRKTRIVNCPTCKHGIEKIGGCDNMQCSVCQTFFSWSSGKLLYSGVQHG